MSKIKTSYDFPDNLTVREGEYPEVFETNLNIP